MLTKKEYKAGYRRGPYGSYKYVGPKKKPYGDLEPSMKYDRKSIRVLKKTIWSICKWAVPIAIIVYVILRFFLVAHCVKASGGFYERMSCGHDRCCEIEPYHDPNTAWQD